MMRFATILTVILMAIFSATAQRALGQEVPVSVSIPQTPPIAGVNHIIWVWFENRENTQITAATAPFFTSFAASNVNMTNFFGVSHPSQPNYLDAFSGSNQGVTNDNHFTFPATTDNLAKQMAVAGRSWRVYAQDYPGGCSDADIVTGGVDGAGAAGQYVRKHNPAISFESVRLDPVQCANIQPLANFDPSVNFAFVVPNMINDMHDGTTAQGDTFLQAFVPLVTSSSDFAHTLLIVTFDEGTSTTNGGGHIYTAVAAPWLTAATVNTTYNHFSALRTIEAIYGLPFLGSAATATTMAEILPPSRTGYDFDGDARADVAVYRPSSGVWFLNRSQLGFSATQFGLPTDKIVPADFDGDGKADIAVYRPSTGFWYYLNSSNNAFNAVQFGVSEDLPSPADFDGDNKADITVFRPSSGVWFRLNSSNGGFSATQFGTSEDRPTLGDFDGDGKADIAVYRPSSGVWFRLNSSNGSFNAVQFGISEDKPVPADYDGDGKADIAVYRPSSGVWYRLNSSNGAFNATQFGVMEDRPSPADFDGDGKADIAVFRPSSGVWFKLGSTSGFSTIQFGTAGDIPTPNAFVQ